MNAIKLRRIMAEKSQKQVAKELGIDAAAISKWESGSHKPREHRLLSLARALNCTVVDLLADVEQVGR